MKLHKTIIAIFAAGVFALTANAQEGGGGGGGGSGSGSGSGSGTTVTGSGWVHINPANDAGVASVTGGYLGPDWMIKFDSNGQVTGGAANYKSTAIPSRALQLSAGDVASISLGAAEKIVVFEGEVTATPRPDGNLDLDVSFNVAATTDVAIGAELSTSINGTDVEGQAGSTDGISVKVTDGHMVGPVGVQTYSNPQNENNTQTSPTTFPPDVVTAGTSSTSTGESESGGGFWNWLSNLF